MPDDNREADVPTSDEEPTTISPDEEPAHELDDTSDEPNAEDEPSNDEPDEESPEESDETASEDDHAKDGHDSSPSKPQGKVKRFFHTYWAKKLWTIPLTILALLGILVLIPTTRYAIAGLFIKKNVSILVVDKQSGKGISDATVTLGGKSGATDKSGIASVAGVKPGPTTIDVSKQYYQSASQPYTVPIGEEKNPPKVELQATGRPVPVVVTNKIGGAPLANVTVKVLDTQAKTDAEGKTVIVVPAGKDKLEATLTASGYNDATVTITVTTQEDPANAFTIVPAGKVYFLSKLSGKIDVVKTNLDGSARQTVVAGTGKEDNADTVLLATRDWKFLALKSKRDGGLAKLFVIDTSTDKMTTMDEGDATFSLTGWLDHTFAYTVSRNAVQEWQPKKTALKAYNADSGQLVTMYENSATGDQNNYAYELFSWNYGVGNSVVLFTTWTARHQYSTTTFSELNGKQAQVLSFTSQNKKSTLKTYDLNATSTYATSYYTPLASYESALYEPNEVYYKTVTYSGTEAFYALQNGKVTDNSEDAKKFFEADNTYPTYLLSPGGTQTFWAEPRDGKNTLFIGDSNGANGKQIASLSEFTPYGWYTDSYLLVSKSGSELYILPSAPTNVATQALKVTDYHKPSTYYRGYGGGYGGL